MPKVKTVAKISIPACAILLVAFIVALQMPRGMEVIVYANLPSVTDEIAILKTVTPEITQERALDIANVVFNVSGEFKELDDVWKVWSGTRTVWVYKSGGIIYDTTEVWGRHLREELPSESACKDIADSFLENLRRKGLLQSTLDTAFKDVVSDEGMIAHRDGRIENYIANIHVNYSLSFSGIKVSGPGAKLRVYIGKGGEVTGFMGNLWEVSERKIVGMLKPEEAIELFKKRDYGAIKAAVRSIELMYYVPPPTVKTAYIIPVYQFNGEFTLEDGSAIGFVEFLPAVPPSEIESMSLTW